MGARASSGRAKVLLQPDSAYSEASQRAGKPENNSPTPPPPKQRWRWQERLLVSLGNVTSSPLPALNHFMRRKKKSALVLVPLRKPKHPFPSAPQIQAIIPGAAASCTNHRSRQFCLLLQTKPTPPVRACSSLNFSCVAYDALTSEDSKQASAP